MNLRDCEVELAALLPGARRFSFVIVDAPVYRAFRRRYAAAWTSAHGLVSHEAREAMEAYRGALEAAREADPRLERSRIDEAAPDAARYYLAVLVLR